MRALLVAGALVAACASAANLGSRDTVAHPVEGDGGAAEGYADASVEARVAGAETAWLVAHLADEPERANPRDSDAVRRLVALGGPGVAAVAEVFRVGDARRAPFARRVVERVATRRCLRDAERAAWVIARVERAAAPVSLGDAGIVWQGRDDRWPPEAVERLRQWGRDGVPCDAPVALTPDGGADGG